MSSEEDEKEWDLDDLPPSLQREFTNKHQIMGALVLERKLIGDVHSHHSMNNASRVKYVCALNGQCSVSKHGNPPLTLSFLL